MAKSSFQSSLLFILKLILILILILAVFLLIYLTYLIYLNTPREPETLNINLDSESSQVTQTAVENIYDSEVKQFHPNMKFNHNNISYSMDFNCKEIQKENMINAFSYISNQTGLINFYEVLNNADIEVICSGYEKNQAEEEKDFFVAGEGGAKEITESGKYNIISNGTVFLYDSPKGAIECDFPNVEVHELIHVFGFNHSESKKSLMYPLISSCNQKLDSSIIEELKKLYSQNNFPDFFFENLSAVKKGRYLDFNVTIKNYGTTDGHNINFEVISDGETIEEKQIEQINYGAGIVFRVENLKLPSLNSKEIKFIIDKNNSIRELNENNNIAIVRSTNA